MSGSKTVEHLFEIVVKADAAGARPGEAKPKPKPFKLLFDLIDWKTLQERIDDLVDEGKTDADIDAEVKAFIDKVAAAIDKVVDFDALINGVWEPVGDFLEVNDFWMVRGALITIWKFARNTRGRLARRLGHIESRLLYEDVGSKTEKALKAKAERLRKRIAALPGPRQ